MIDIFELARVGGVIEGQVPFDAAPRLRADLRDATGTVDFRLEGRIDEWGRPAASLFLRSELPLACDRCAQLLMFHLEQRGSFYFVRDESELASLPVAAEEDSEPLLGSASFDVAALVEDEAILCIPISPRHAECTPADEAAAAGDTAGANPFAGLSELLRKRGQ